LGRAVKSSNQSNVFGRRKEPHTIIIAHGDELRHFTVRPWVVAFVGSVFAAIAIGYLTATTYLVLRDDLIGASAARQARMQQAYEDRISALRAQVDRITSRQLLDQQLVETKVGELLQRQSELTQRHQSLAPVLGDPDSSLPAAGPVPSDKPDQRASLKTFMDKPGAALAYASADSASSPFSLWSTRKRDANAPSSADRADMMFVAINRSLRTIEADQMNRVVTLADNAYETAEAIGDALESAGLKVDGDFDKTDVGGPLVPVDSASMFDSKVKELDDALGKLDTLKKQVRLVPVANPARNWSVSSTFGVRKDPLLGTPALHSGMDFRAPTGAPIKATASGVVAKAGWNGGYGRMVEIDHGNGLATRFAHMSKILVKEGDQINIGDVVGQVGSSGRSTGPHLHYEIRKNGAAIDPLRFIKAGKQIDRYMAAL
jgi:murein DD-endopeptidase MepM/ murein hydrolase activator NlpD